MSFQERITVINDDEEWLNIPPVLRKLLRSINDENEQNKTLTEALRREQQDTNVLLRRLIQKQTDMELDFAHNKLLHLSKPHQMGDISSSVKPEKNLDGESLRKKFEHVNERLKGVDNQLKKTQSRFGKLESFEKRVEALEASTCAQTKEVEGRMQEIQSALREKSSALQVSQQALSKEIQLRNEQDDEQAALLSHIVQSIKTKEEAYADLSTYVQDLESTVKVIENTAKEKYAVFDKRFVVLQRSIDKIHGVFESTRKSTVEHQENTSTSVKQEMTDLIGQRFADCQRLYVETRRQLCECQDVLAAEKESTKQQFTVIRDRLRDVTESETRLTSSDREASERHRTLSESLAHLQAGLVALKGQVEGVAGVTKHLSELQVAEKKSGRDSLTSTFEKVRSLESDLSQTKEMCETLTSRMTSELGRLRSSVGEQEVTLQHNGQSVMKLSNVVFDLSATVQKLQQSSTAPSPQTFSTDGSAALVANLRKYVDEIMQTFRSEGSISRETQQALQAKHEATSHRLDIAERRLTDLATNISAAPQQPFPTSALPRWAEDALKELRPALVEIETIKRRLVAAEAREHHELSLDRSDSSRKAEAQLQLADTLEDTRRRLLEVSHRVHALDQLVGKASKDSQRALELSHGAGDASVRLAGDLTSALEKLETTEMSLAQLRDAAAEAEQRSGGKFKSLEAALVEVTEAAQRQSEYVHAATVSIQSQSSALESVVRRALEDAEQKASQHSLELRSYVSAEVEKGMNRARDEYRTAEEAVAGLRAASQEQQQSTSELEERVRTVEQTRSDRLQADNDAMHEETKLRKLEAHLRDHSAMLLSHTCQLQDLTERALPSLSATVDEKLGALRTREDELRTSLLADGAGLTGHVMDAVARLSVAEGKLASLEEAHPLAEAALVEVRRQLEELLVRLPVDGITVSAAESAATAPSNCAEECAATIGELKRQLSALTENLTRAEQDLRVYAYPRTELEERLENLWTSVVSLLARKEDTSSVGTRLQELHDLVLAQTQVKIDHLAASLDTSLQEKVGLQELQDILEGATGYGEDGNESEL